MTVRIVIVLLLMMGGYAHIVDVCSAFLLGMFSNGERLYATVPECWEHKFPPNAFLLLMRTIYGLKQAANCFYRLLVSIMTGLIFTNSLADPCLYHKWHPEHGLLLWISYCDDLMCVGRTKKSVLDEVEAVKTHFNVNDVGALADYLGCNLTFNWDERSCRFTQPVLVQSLRDEYNATDKETTVPATPGSVLCRPSKGDEGLADGLQKEYKGKVGRLLHMVAWTS